MSIQQNINQSVGMASLLYKAVGANIEAQKKIKAQATAQAEEKRKLMATQQAEAAEKVRKAEEAAKKSRAATYKLLTGKELEEM